MTKKLIMAIGVTALMVIWANSTWSDIAPIKDLRGVTLATQDKAAEQIEMRAEEVYLELGKKTMSVKAVFHMYNEGPELKIKEGFPEGHYKNILKNFTVTCRGETVKTDIINLYGEGKKIHNKIIHDYWLAWENTYPANSQQDIEVTYTVDIPGHNFPDGTPDPNMHYTGYILHTGAAWKGVIGQAKIILTFKDGLTPLHIMNIARPKKAVIEKDKIIWTFKNLEPSQKDNINFSFFISKDYPQILKDYENSSHSLKNTKEVKLYAKLHDRKNYWRLSKELMEIGEKKENGERVTSGRNDDARWFLEHEVISVFCESLKYAKKEEGALETLPAATALFETMLDNKVFHDYTGVTYPNGRKGNKELIKINLLNYPYKEEYDYPHDRGIFGIGNDKEPGLSEKHKIAMAKEMIKEDLLEAHKLIDADKKK